MVTVKLKQQYYFSFHFIIFRYNNNHSGFPPVSIPFNVYLYVYVIISFILKIFYIYFLRYSFRNQYANIIQRYASLKWWKQMRPTHTHTTTAFIFFQLKNSNFFSLKIGFENIGSNKQQYMRQWIYENKIIRVIHFIIDDAIFIILACVENLCSLLFAWYFSTDDQ